MLKAFTIIELMVVSVLSTVCVAAGFTAFQIIEREFWVYNENASMSIEVSALNSLLQRDCMQSEFVTYEESMIVFQKPKYDLVYQFGEAKIIRQVLIEGVLADTFNLSPIKVYASYQNVPTDNGVVDKIKLETIAANGEIFKFLINKQYSAQQLINN